MGKIGLIIQREYLTRVKKKSFIIMTILGPLLMGSIAVVPAWLAMQNEEVQEVVVVDESYVFIGGLPETENLKFFYDPGMSRQDAKQALLADKYSALLYIPSNVMSSNAVVLEYKKNPGVSTVYQIEQGLEDKLIEYKFKKSGIDKEWLDNTKKQSQITMDTQKINQAGKGKTDKTMVSTGVGMFAGILIYIFIFLYGAQVMRGVIEEKTSRIVEVIISSVKPFQLMMGKITGVAMVGLTQFLLWVMLTFLVITAVMSAFGGAAVTPMKKGTPMEEIMGVQSQAQPNPMDEITSGGADKVMKELFGHISITTILFSFLFYFIGGYLLYGAFFAAIGAAVDNEADTQQFMLPITIPLIFSFVMAQFVINNPEGPVAFWLSIIPFTSPVIMMVRLPFGVPLPELLLSMGLLVAGFVFTTWLAGRVYRVGILMYGKKPSYKELWKWLFYRG